MKISQVTPIGGIDRKNPLLLEGFFYGLVSCQVLRDNTMDDNKILSIITDLSSSVPEQDLPKKVYHYTGTNGALGILQMNEMWLSHARFSNDSEELKYAQRLVEHLVEQELKKIPLDEPAKNYKFAAREFLFKLQHYTGNKSYESHVFVACFCEDNDLLSLWRGYTEGSGFNIGFKAKELLESAKKSFPHAEVNFSTVLYDQSNWEQKIRKNCRAICDFIINQPPGKSFEEMSIINEKAAQILAGLISSMAPFVKHPKFSEEKEWRLAIKLPEYHKKIKFRPSSIGILPYIKIRTDTSSISVMVGPKKDKFLSLQALEMLIQGRNIRIDMSTVPLR